MAIELIPTEYGGTNEVGGVAIEEVGGVCFALAHILLFDKGKFAFCLVEEIALSRFDVLATFAPAHGGKLVGLTIVPDESIVAITVLSANL